MNTILLVLCCGILLQVQKSCLGCPDMEFSCSCQVNMLMKDNQGLDFFVKKPPLYHFNVEKVSKNENSNVR